MFGQRTSSKLKRHFNILFYRSCMWAKIFKHQALVKRFHRVDVKSGATASSDMILGPLRDFYMTF